MLDVFKIFYTLRKITLTIPSEIHTDPIEKKSDARVNSLQNQLAPNNTRKAGRGGMRQRIATSELDLAQLSTDSRDQDSFERS